jgi:hypothetical protein
MTARTNDRLPPLCYIAHPTTGATVAIHRGENGYRDPGTLCSPACLNNHLPHPPTEDDISAMRHGSLIGWDTPGADPAFWRRRREGRGA